MASDSRRSERGRFKYGICLNDECQCCKDKKVQQIPMRKEFVCAECGKELRECPPPKQASKTPLIAAAAVAVAAIIGGGLFYFIGGSQDDTTAPNVAVVDTTSHADAIEHEDTTVTLEEQKTISSTETNYRKNEKDIAKSQEKVEKQISSSSDIITIKIGKYEGPLSDGKPDGIGGSIVVTTSYTIDLKDGNSGSVTLSAGDRITGTKFKNGVLQQGQLIRSNGERKFLSGLSEKLK